MMADQLRLRDATITRLSHDITTLRTELIRSRGKNAELAERLRAAKRPTVVIQRRVGLLDWLINRKDPPPHEQTRPEPQSWLG